MKSVLLTESLSGRITAFQPLVGVAGAPECGFAVAGGAKSAQLREMRRCLS